jgi:hypothetical protein
MRRRFEPDHPGLIIVAEPPPANGLYFYDTTGRAGLVREFAPGQARPFRRGSGLLCEFAPGRLSFARA